MRAPFLLILILLFSCSKESDSESYSPTEQFNDGIGHALLVGIEKTNLIGYDKIKGVNSNIKRINKIITKRKFTKIQVLDKNPKKREILSSLSQKLNQLRPNDLFLFYFFGHGDQIPDTSGDERKNNKKDVEDEVLIAQDSIIIDDEINNILRSSNTQGRVIFIIESCHSGTSYEIIKNKSWFQRVFGRKKFVNEEIGEQLIDDEKEMPNFIYMGATTDPKKAPLFSDGGIYTSALSTIWKRKKGNMMNYLEFYEKLKLKLSIKPVISVKYADDKFINNKFLKIN